MSNFDYKEYNCSNDYFSLEATDFPKVYIKFKNKQPTDNEFEEYMNCISTVFLQQRPYVVLTDMSDTGYLKAKYRTQVSQMIDKNREHLSEVCKGIVYLTGSSIHKFLLQSIFSIQTQPYSHTVVNKEEQAHEWLDQQLDK